jgi:hypothetical protein
MTKFVTIVAFALVIGVIGCATLPIESNLEKPVSMTEMTDLPNERFVVQKQAFWLFWGLIPVLMPEVDEVVGRVAADHAGVQNLKITTELSFINLLLLAITDGVIYSQSVIIEGEVYDY